MILVHPLEKWELSCPHYFPTYYGRLDDPCDIIGKDIYNIWLCHLVVVVVVVVLQLKCHCLTWCIMCFLSMYREIYLYWNYSFDLLLVHNLILSEPLLFIWKYQLLKWSM